MTHRESLDSSPGLNPSTAATQPPCGCWEQLLLVSMLADRGRFTAAHSASLAGGSLLEDFLEDEWKEDKDYLGGHQQGLEVSSVREEMPWLNSPECINFRKAKCMGLRPGASVAPAPNSQSQTPTRSPVAPTVPTW